MTDDVDRLMQDAERVASRRLGYLVGGAGLSATEALDFAAVEESDAFDVSSWANMTDREPSTVRSSLSRARRKVADDEDA